VPCIFETSFEGFKIARTQIAKALGTGQVEFWAKERSAIPARSEFESQIFADALDQVSGFLGALERGIAELEVTLGAPARDHLIMEFYLPDLPKSRIEEALALMDRIDSERNAVVMILNHLFEYAGAPQLPGITMSSKLIEISAILEKLGLEYSWPVFYFRSHRAIMQKLDPDRYDAFWKREISKEEKRWVEEHVAAVLANKIAQVWGRDADDGRPERGVAGLRRLQIALSFPAWRGERSPKLKEAIDQKVASMGYPTDRWPDRVPKQDSELRSFLDKLLAPPSKYPSNEKLAEDKGATRSSTKKRPRR
jgi:hypothetical protein